MADNDVNTTSNTTLPNADPDTGEGHMGETDVSVTAYPGEGDIPSGTVTTTAEPPTPRVGISNAEAFSVPGAPNATQNVAQFGAQAPEAGLKKPTLPTPTRNNPPAPPAVTQKASWIHDIAETLAGGPQYSYKIDPNTGEMTKTAVPVSGKHLAMAIALEALQGAATGMAAGKGAGNQFKAPAAAMAQTQGQVMQRDERQQQLAQQDFARKAAIAETNMRMAMNQRILSQHDEEAHDKYVKMYAPLYDKANQLNGIQQVVHGSDALNKLVANGTLQGAGQNALPIRYFQVMGQDGQPLKGPNGEPKLDYDYAVLKPGTQLTLPKEAQDVLVKYHVPGYSTQDKDGKWVATALPEDWETRADVIIGGMEKAQQFINDELAIKQISGIRENIEKTLAPKAAPEGAPKGSPAAPSTMPTLKQYIAGDGGKPDFNKAADAIQKYEGTDPKNLNMRNNNPGNLEVGDKADNWVTKAPGYQGFEEKNGQKYAKFDTYDHGRAALISKLQNDYNKYGDLPLDQWINQHYAPDTAPGNKAGGALKYASALVGAQPPAAGAAQEQAQEQVPGFEKMSDADIQDTLHGLTTKQRDLLAQWRLFYSPEPGKPAPIEEWTKPDYQGRVRADPADVGAVRNVLNKLMPEEAYQQGLAKQAEQRKLDLLQGQEDLKEKQQKDLEAEASKLLAVPKDFAIPPDIMTMGAAKAAETLKNMGVQIPANFDDIYAMARGKSDSKDFTPRVYKGVGGVMGMNRTMAKDYVYKFLKPDWEESDYDNRRQFIADLAPSRKAGGVLYNAGVATQHLALAEQLFKNINNRQSPIWNEAANWLGVNVAGMPEAAVYDTVRNMLAAEVAKVASGTGEVTDTSKKQVNDQLGNYQSPQMAVQNFGALIKLMEPRLKGIANSAKEWDLMPYYTRYVSPETARVFSEHGIDTPGYGKAVRKDGKLIGFTEDNGKSMTPYQGM